MKIAVLWTGLSGYFNSCLRELCSRDGVEIMVVHSAPASDAPYAMQQLKSVTHYLQWRQPSDLLPLGDLLSVFSPDVIVFAGWTIPAYRRAAKHWKGRALRIMTMDNPWKGTPKQRLGALTAGIYIHPLADAVWVPGERQTTFARAMGFDQNQILRGLYSCDYESFRSVSKTDEEKRRFVFVGRFVSDKGIETLVAGYKKYRSMAIEPWELHCYGCGPLESKLQDQPGLTIKGFVQPDELPLEFAAASCLLLPSINENWAVVIHEAASAGLAILASEAAGAVAHLVQPRYNGYIFGVRDDNGLAEALNIFSMLPPDKRIAMSKASVSLAGQFTPTLWADGLLDFAKHNLKKVLTLVTGSV